MELDSFALNILKLLQKDGRLSVEKLSNKVGLSQAPCWRRLRTMEKQGLIKSRVALIDEKKIGLNVYVYCFITIEDQSENALIQFESQIAELREVMECYSSGGKNRLYFKSLGFLTF